MQYDLPHHSQSQNFNLIDFSTLFEGEFYREDCKGAKQILRAAKSKEKL